MAGGVNLLICFFICVFLFDYVYSAIGMDLIDADVLQTSALAFWPNGTVPFFVDQEHYDAEQSIAILTALSLFASKTCLKFVPVMARPSGNEHILVLQNPTGVRKCTISSDPHSIDEPHLVTLGYDCLKSPDIDMMIMKALGFPFEHNRGVRDYYITVETENVEPGYLDLFTKDLRLPIELGVIPYDVNSVMHFEPRAFSANGHRTIMFKNSNLRQERTSLSPLDLRKIDIVYGPECRKRDRQEKIELCQNYPGVARRKRDVIEIQRSLRVNPDITPPSYISGLSNNDSDTAIIYAANYTNDLVKQLDIEKEIEVFIEQVNKISLIALSKARDRLCGNQTKSTLRNGIEREKPKILDIIGELTMYANLLIYQATKNLTEFCAESGSMVEYQRAGCPFFDKKNCPMRYKSTKSGPVKYSTQHRPVYKKSTQAEIPKVKGAYVKLGGVRKSASINESILEEKEGEGVTSPVSPVATSAKRRKRDADLKGTTKEAHSTVENNSSLQNTNTDAVAEVEATEADTDKTKHKLDAKRVVEITNTTSKFKDEKVVKVKKDADKLKPVRRRFESQRFRSKKDAQNGDYERGLKERQWDFSGVSLEKPMHGRSEELKEVSQPRRMILKRAKPRADNSRYDYLATRDDEGGLAQTSQQPNIRTLSRSRYKPQFDEEEQISEEINTRYNNDRARGTLNKNSRFKVVREEHDASKADEVTPKKTISVKKLVRRPTKKIPEIPVGKKKSKGRPRDSGETSEPLKPQKYRETQEDLPRGFQEPRETNNPPESREVPDYNAAPDEVKPATLPKTVQLSKKNREFYDERKWPEGVVRYLIKDNGDPEIDVDDVRRRIGEVKSQLERETCVRLEELFESDADMYEDYLVLDNSPDYVTGRVGGKQTFGAVELLRGGQHRQHAAMVVMAMLGFYFEVARHDRDKYIRVHMRHVRPDKLHHFEKIRDDATLPLPYDYKSATHPSWQFWRQLGRTGISSVATYKERDPDGSVMKALGQNEQLLSDLDIVKINSVYGVDCFLGKRKKHKKQKSKKQHKIRKEVVGDREGEEEVGKREELDVSN